MLHSRLIYEASLLFWRMIIRVFFREIRPRGAFNMPRDGPVILVAAPHHNQACLILALLNFYGINMTIVC